MPSLFPCSPVICEWSWKKTQIEKKKKKKKKESELKDVDKKSRKTITMYRALHPESDVDRL